MLVVLVLVLLVCSSFAGITPLDQYIAAPDSAYNWTIAKKWSGTFGFTAYDLLLTSQNWLTPEDSVNGYTWTHWLQVCIPDRPVQTDLAFLYIDGGNRPKSASPPTTIDGGSAHLTELLCVDSQTVSVAVLGIPMEPICFAENDPGCYVEDGLIAYTWKHFYNDSNPMWLLRLPMVKAVVKAMDAVSEFTASLGSPVVPVARYVVAGASKRGWTTWLTAAVDPRVVAMVPMVMPILNIVPNMNHHNQAYNGWSFALSDYIGFGLMAELNEPFFLELAAVVDPWSYRDRLTMPKLIMTACGDEFFLPDSPQFFMKGLQQIGETHLTVIANAEHSLATAYVDVGETLCAFYHTVLYDLPRPSYSYALTYGIQNASITVTVDPSFPPTYVKVWKATTLGERSPYRDFRLVICEPTQQEPLPDCIQPIIWSAEYLSPLPNDPYTYVASESAPEKGWTGFEIEMTWQYNDHDSVQILKMSSEVNVVPDVMPFPSCGYSCQPTATEPDQFGIYH